PLARPFGCLSVADRRSSFAEFTAPADTTMMSPAYRSSWPSCDTTTWVTAVPAELVSSRTACASISNVTFGYSRAGRTPSVSPSDFACSGHGKPSQLLHFTHVLNGMFASLSMTPQGAWNGWKPDAARSSESCWMRGSCATGGNGYCLLHAPS